LPISDRAERGIKTPGCRSVWREFEFIFIVVRNAIVPVVPIENLIQNWKRIKRNLAENSRKRKLKSEDIKLLLK